MSARKQQARITDLPGYHLTMSVEEIPDRPGSWGWINSGYVGRDAVGYLWVIASAVPQAQPGVPQERFSLVQWSEDGVALYMPPESYGLIKTITETGREDYIPIAEVLTEVPPSAVTPS